MAESMVIGWSNLRAGASAEGVPQAILDLELAESAESAERAYWKIDNIIVVQGALFEAALPAASLLLMALKNCKGAGRPFILELLGQLANGAPAPSEVEKGNHELGRRCCDLICKERGYLLSILEAGSEEEKFHCIDLLGLCALRDPSFRTEYRLSMRHLLDEGVSAEMQLLIENGLLELAPSTPPKHRAG